MEMTDRCHECPFEFLCQEIGPDAAHEFIAFMVMIEALAEAAARAEQAQMERFVGVN